MSPPRFRVSCPAWLRGPGAPRISPTVCGSPLRRSGRTACSTVRTGRWWRSALGGWGRPPLLGGWEGRGGGRGGGGGGGKAAVDSLRGELSWGERAGVFGGNAADISPRR